jgi:hypothetical protein
MVISKYFSNEYVKVSPEEDLTQERHLTSPSYPPKVEPLILLNALTGFYTPQTIKLIGYIKQKKFIILVDSGSTHNFIHRRLAQEINFYICVVNNFQIMIVNGGSMKCWGHCENVHLQIGHYKFKYHMFSINMGGCDILLVVEWICTLGPISMDFKELIRQVQHEGKQYKFQGITSGSREIIISHHMENLLKKSHSGIIYQLHSIQVVESPSVHPNLQSVISQNHFILKTPLFPSHINHDHSITLIPISLPPNVHPYPHHFSQKNEIEKIVQELLEVGVIRPSTNPYSSLIVMVLKKEGT